MIVWLNGALVDQARIDPTDRGFTLGDGLFETIRAVGGRPCHAALHLARLRNGAGVLALPLPVDDATLEAAMEAVLAACGLTAATLRLTVTRGPAPRGVLPPAELRPTLLLSAGPAGGPLPPARLIVASVTRRNEFSPLSRIKSLNYLDNILARQEAAARDADEAVLLNTQGRVAETTTANLFALVDGMIVTPPVSEGALPGIGRRLILDAVTVAERPLSLENLRRAEEIVLTNSLGARRIAALDGVPMADSQRLYLSLRQLVSPMP